MNKAGIADRGPRAAGAGDDVDAAAVKVAVALSQTVASTGLALIVGEVLAVTVIFRVPVTVELPSLACKVKVAVDASELATMSAVIFPSELMMLEIVTPFAGLAEVTVMLTLPLPP